MSLKNNLKYIATPSRIIITGLILLAVIHIIQLFAFQISMEIERNWLSKSKQKRQSPINNLTKEEKELEGIRNLAKKFMPDGTVLLVKVGNPGRRMYFHYDNNNKIDDNATTTIYDKDCKLLWEGKYKDKPYSYLQWPQSIHDMGRMDRLDGYRMIAPELSRSLEIPVFKNGKMAEMWRYNWERQYFEGYAVGGGKIGFVGAEGFSESASQTVKLGDVKCFTAWSRQDNASTEILIMTENRFYEFDFGNKQFDMLYETSDSHINPDMIAWTNWRSPKYAHDLETVEYRPTIQFQTSDRKQHLLLKDPQEVFSFEVPQDWQAPYVQMTSTNKGIFALNIGSSRWLPKKHMGSNEKIKQWYEDQKTKPVRSWNNLYKIDPSGSVELINHFEWTTSNTRIHYPFSDESFSGKVHKYANSVSPLAYRLPAKLWQMSQQQTAQGRRRYIVKLARSLNMVFPGNITICMMISAVMVLFVVLHSWSRRTSWARFIGWIVFTAAFNLAGLLTYLALKHTTVIKCGDCGKRRGLEIENCIRCDSPLPIPQPRQTDLILHS